MMNQVLWDHTARVSMEDDGLLMRCLDLEDRMPLIQRLNDTFLIDYSRDGSPDSDVDWTFIRDRQNPNEVDWVRFRMTVGERVGQFPERVPIVGAACGPLTFTPEMDIPL